MGFLRERREWPVRDRFLRILVLKSRNRVATVGKLCNHRVFWSTMIFPSRFPRQFVILECLHHSDRLLGIQLIGEKVRQRDGCLHPFCI